MHYLRNLVIAWTIATAVFAPLAVLASEPEIIDIERQTSVIFLLDAACKPNLYTDYVERFADAWIVCREETNWIQARDSLYGFEKYWHVVYVTQDNQHPRAGEGIKGEAFYRDGANYAYAVNNPIVIAHELSHLKERVFFTSDGRHDGEKNAYLWLWKIERGA